LVDLNARVGKDDKCKPTIINESLCGSTKDNGLRVVNSATSISLIVRSTMLPHPNIHTLGFLIMQKCTIKLIMS
jgi:hypothetical protein